jgi:hypothetical protein
MPNLKKSVCYFLLILCLSTSNSYANCKISPNSNLVFLKLDDVVANKPKNNDVGVSRKWELVTNYLESHGLKASYGVIGESLESENPAYFAWLKKRVSNGYIELWNHGYTESFKKKPDIGILGEFSGPSAAEQAETLRKSQSLGIEKINYQFKGFGPHSAWIDSKTYDQLDKFNEIKYVWFAQALGGKLHKQFVFKHTVDLETPISKPNYDIFVESYTTRLKSLGYIAIQGHPNLWDDQSFESFTRVIDYLISNNATFCRPSDSLQ